MRSVVRNITNGQAGDFHRGGPGSTEERRIFHCHAVPTTNEYVVGSLFAIQTQVLDGPEARRVRYVGMRTSPTMLQNEDVSTRSIQRKTGPENRQQAEYRK